LISLLSKNTENENGVEEIRLRNKNEQTKKNISGLIFFMIISLFLSNMANAQTSGKNIAPFPD